MSIDQRSVLRLQRLVRNVKKGPDYAPLHKLCTMKTVSGKSLHFFLDTESVLLYEVEWQH